MVVKILRTRFTEEFLKTSKNREYQKNFDEGIMIFADTREEVEDEINKIYETENLDPISWFSEIVDYPGPGWRAVGNIRRFKTSQ